MRRYPITWSEKYGDLGHLDLFKQNASVLERRITQADSERSPLMPPSGNPLPD